MVLVSPTGNGIMDIDMGAKELFPGADGAGSAPAFIAIGDSFTEGMNDPDPGGGFRGWSDRLAGMLAVEYPELRYANLSIRGKLLGQIVDEQLPEALELAASSDGPVLVSLAGGGNDILRPGSDPDAMAELFDSAVARLREAGCQVMMFTGFDPMAFPVMRLLRGRIAAYNMHLRAIADERDCYLVDLWSMRVLRDPGAWSADRLHLTSGSHQRVALRAAEVLGLPVTEDWRDITAAVPASAVAVGSSAYTRSAWLAARREDVRWAREYFVPWVNRRIRGTSSGDGLLAKRPALQPVTPVVTG